MYIYTFRESRFGKVSRLYSVSCGNGNEMKREKITIHRPSVSKRPYTDIMLWTEGSQLICFCSTTTTYASQIEKGQGIHGWFDTALWCADECVFIIMYSPFNISIVASASSAAQKH